MLSYKLKHVFSSFVDIFQMVIILSAQIMESVSATGVSVMRSMKGNTVKIVR